VVSTAQSGAANALAESAGSITDPQLRPGQAQISYRRADSVRLAGLDGQSDVALKLDPGGTVGQALWAPGGRTLLYLSVPAERNQSIGLREYTPEDATDKLVAKTSQFASFGINGDSSVFVGASRSLASPYVLLLLRMARRELTLCEHRSSDPVAVEPVFSPDSQSVFFTSDRKGKRAIYRAHVEKFVEETPEE
jgi:oligogalacturonide lyase